MNLKENKEIIVHKPSCTKKEAIQIYNDLLENKDDGI